ncbi:mating-type protein MAT alpha 1-domain-containing protein [Exophiala viscosa]|uniref:Mating-type protein MAT alpha 1-domain-containing protein n=1 Tax=Exophiala viscosa TaxID=2486360 RepID=A0AAN6DWI2_9EURO|nr:mating-type protein MAT alpha 1-domain-containing protein [Exophiala viscosa]KAI1625796.1 mating-type protein MAT alpha 1-domain-containing protein [Exophiala viscosa]
MAASNAFPSAFAALFNSLSSEQLSALSGSLALAAELKTSVANMSSGDDVSVASTSASERKFARAQRRKAVVARFKQKRPLNAFITYRTYYSPIFKGLPQKQKSGLMRQMWGQESKHSIWALLGSAYSDLRDHHQETLPVDKFLSIAIPLLPIIPADKYLSKMGWTLSSEAAGEPVLFRNPAFNADILAAEYPPQTNLSLEDIVGQCYDQGLLPRANRRDLMQVLRDEGLMDVLPPADQTPPSTCGTLTLAVTPQSTTTMTTQPSSIETTPEPSDDGNVDGPVCEHEENNELSMDAIINSNAYLSVAAVTAEQQDAFESNSLALHFHPDVSPPILGFDPRVIQDDFDPFNLDLSELINFDA